MGPFETKFDLQPERNLGLITELVTGVAERPGAADCTRAGTPRSFPDSANCFAFVPVEAAEIVPRIPANAVKVMKNIAVETFGRWPKVCYLGKHHQATWGNKSWDDSQLSLKER